MEQKSCGWEEYHYIYLFGDEKPFLTAPKVKSALKDVGLDVPLSTIKRRICSEDSPKDANHW